MNRVVFCLIALLLAGGMWFSSALAQMPEIQLGDQRYELQYTIGDENSDVFFQTISSAVVGPEGQVIVADGRSNFIVSYSADGRHQWTIDQAGEGPGELNRPGALSFRNELLMFSNQRGSRVDSYSTDGEFVQSRSFSEFGIERAGICGWLDEDRVVVTHPMNTSYGNHLYIVEWEAGTIQREQEFRLPGVGDPPQGFNIGTGCEVVDGAILISHAFTDGFWRLNEDFEVEGRVEESDANFYPPVLTRFDNGNLSALFPVDVDFGIIEEHAALTNVRWPCEHRTVESYEDAVKAGEDIAICRTVRLFNSDGKLGQILFTGPQEDAPFTYVQASTDGWLAVQPDVNYPMLAMYRWVSR